MIAYPEHGDYQFNDGLGVRTLDPDPRQGRVETLRVSATLAEHPAVEQVIRARAARYAELGGTLTPVYRVDRDKAGLRVLAHAPDGVRLSDILRYVATGDEALPDAGVLELAAAAIKAVATVHQLPGLIAHGSITPAHIVLSSEGTAVLTDGVFGAAVEALKRNREEIWREFGLALPASANLPRFDQRADVTQLGACVLAIVLRRPLTADEYPRGIADLVFAATPDTAPHSSGLRMWLQQTMQLHSRAMFSNAVEAQKSFVETVATPGTKRGGRQAMLALVSRCSFFRTAVERMEGVRTTTRPHLHDRAFSAVRDEATAQLRTSNAGPSASIALLAGRPAVERRRR
jgi:hypothetical protein